MMIDPPRRPAARQPDNRRFPVSLGSFLVGITPAPSGSHLVGQDLYFYIENNAGTLVNYGMRYYKGLPISSSIAESAVNQVVSHRMAKKQQMRWTDEGAHRLAQVRVADLNGELSVQRLAALAKMPGANSSYARQAA
jgi:hypothetical protein